MAYEFLLPLCMIALALVLVFLVPLAFWRKSRAFSGGGLMIASYFFGVTVWILSFSVTLSTFGWIGLFFGVITGIGVFPIAIFGAFSIDNGRLAIYIFSILAIAIITFASGIFVISKIKK
jgi:hypothetical protein